MSFFSKKKASTKANAANVHMTEAEAALAQSDFNIDKILEIQNKFTGGTALLLPGRIFIREGMLWKVCRKGPKKRQFFLFNDILVYGSVVAGRYSNQHVLPLAHMAVSGDPSYQPEINTTFTIDSLDEQLDVHNAFQISHADKSFHVFSLSQADKANWLANLQKHINKVALVGGSQAVAPRAVWVPDSHSKDCMICGQKFTAFNRKHHCRQCGRVVCSTCSPHRVIIDSQSDAKPERVCSECVKDVSPIKAKASPEVSTQPPSAAVAAQLVSSVLRHNSEHQSPSHTQSAQSPRQHRRNSTDTEDSDDSEEEDRGAGTPPTKKKPTPVPRRTQSEKHVSPTGSPVVPPQRPPQRPPPFNSVRRPRVSSPITELPKPKPRVKKPEVEVETAAKREGEEGSEAGREREKGKGAEGEGEGEGAGGEGGKGEVGEGEGGKGEGGEGEGGKGEVADEVQPTPPPRKRKKAKLKQKLEQQLQQQLKPNDHHLVGEVQQDGASAAMEEKGEEEGVSIAEEEERTTKEVLGEEEEGQQGSEGDGAQVVGEEGQQGSEGEAQEVKEEEQQGSEGEGAQVVREEGQQESEGEGAPVVIEDQQGSEGGAQVVRDEGQQESEGEGAQVVIEEQEGSEGEGAQEVGVTDGLEVVEATESVEDEGLLVTEQEVAEEEGEGVPADGEVEDSGDKRPETGPRRPRRRRKHFNEGQEEGGTTLEDTPTQTDSTHQLEDTPTQTDSTHRDDSTADQDPSSQTSTTSRETDQMEAEREDVPSEELPADNKLPGQPPDLLGQPEESGQPTEGAPVKKPRGRKPKFKTAETQ